MNECPMCESAATDVQMLKAALNAARQEIERLAGENINLRSAYSKDTQRLMRERDFYKAEAMRMHADRTYV